MRVSNEGNNIDRQLASEVTDSATDVANARENKTMAVHLQACLDG